MTLAAHAFNEPRCIEGIEAARDAYRDGSLRERLSRYHGEGTDHAFRGWCDAWLAPEFEHWSIEEELPGVDVPLLVVQGRNDAYGTLRQVEVIADRTAGPARTLVLDDCGHSSPPPGSGAGDDRGGRALRRGRTLAAGRPCALSTPSSSTR